MELVNELFGIMALIVGISCGVAVYGSRCERTKNN